SSSRGYVLLRRYCSRKARSSPPCSRWWSGSRIGRTLRWRRRSTASRRKARCWPGARRCGLGPPGGGGEEPRGRGGGAGRGGWGSATRAVAARVRQALSDAGGGLELEALRRRVPEALLPAVLRRLRRLGWVDEERSVTAPRLRARTALAVSLVPPGDGEMGGA